MSIEPGPDGEFSVEQAQHVAEQHDAYLRDLARSAGVMRDALVEHGFTDEGAEQLTDTWLADYIGD